MYFTSIYVKRVVAMGARNRIMKQLTDSSWLTLLKRLLCSDSVVLSTLKHYLLLASPNRVRARGDKGYDGSVGALKLWSVVFSLSFHLNIKYLNLKSYTLTPDIQGF